MNWLGFHRVRPSCFLFSRSGFTESTPEPPPSLTTARARWVLGVLHSREGLAKARGHSSLQATSRGGTMRQSHSPANLWRLVGPLSCQAPTTSVCCSQWPRCTAVTGVTERSEGVEGRGTMGSLSTEGRTRGYTVYKPKDAGTGHTAAWTVEGRAVTSRTVHRN